ncbi:MAG: tetratricopeptide repeat protein, partial [Ignavibacteriae bacterium]|nr:tetratricopeptide repeat protein [Ignavibacteriota bacterium]
AHERLKQFDEALYDYSKVIELKPNDTIAFFNKGVVYDAIENPWQAIKEYDEVVKRDPRLAKAYYNRGAAYERVADYDRALQDYEKAVQYNPKYKDELAKKMDYLNYTK